METKQATWEDKLIPGTPAPSSIPGRDWYPSGKCDGVIFRAAKQELTVKNGEYVPKGGFVKIGDTNVPIYDKTAKDLEAKALRYLKPSSVEDRTTKFGYTHDIGLVSHLAGIVDRLAKHFPILQKDRDAGYNLLCWSAMDDVGKRMLDPDIFAFLKVVKVEEGIFAILYDPNEEIA